MSAESSTKPAAPEPPEKPLPMDCCESGCQVCVFDSYLDALDEYKQALRVWQQEHGELAKD